MPQDLSAVRGLAVDRPSHTCLVVNDLEAGAAHLRGVFGPFVELRSAAGGDDFVIQGERRRVPLRVAWSKAGPVHLELIESVAGSLWPPRLEPYLHHQGYWVSDLEGVSDRLAALGWPLEASQWSPDRRPTRFAYHLHPGGMRIEIRVVGGPSLDGPPIPRPTPWPLRPPAATGPAESRRRRDPRSG